MVTVFRPQDFEPSTFDDFARISAVPPRTTYDASTRVRTQTYDFDLDGNPDRTVVRTYNTAGRIMSIVVSSDYGDDGTINRINAFTINEGGTRLKAVVSADDNNDGEFDARMIRTYYGDGSLKYSEFQRLVDGLPQRAGVDSNGDGTYDRTIDYAYDQHNRLLSETWQNIPGVPTTSPSRLIRYTYDDDDRVLTETWDNGINGTIDRRTTNTYHQDGSLKYSETQSLVDGLPRTATVDSNGDGTDDRIVNYTYDQHNRLLTERWQNIPGAPTNTASRSISYTYDDDDRVQTETWVDTSSASTTPPSRLTRYTYDDDDRVLTETWDNGINDTIDRRITNTYDDHGGRVTTVTDYGRNRLQDRTDTFTYDANDNVLTETWDFSATNSIDVSIVRTYDANNNVLTEAWDTDADSINESVFTYTYDADGTKIGDVSSYDTNEDGTIDHVRYNNFGTAVNTILPTAQSAQALAGVETITLSEGASRLVISDSVLSVLAGGDNSYRVRIDGDEHDSVVLGQGIRNSGQDVEINGEQYDLYTGTSGSVLVDPDVMVDLALA
ncbi:RHS repeat protein [Ruegeria atlantica]|uniref:RHS repeat protein n=1 Tax=Ruegeria atlantica TaxID=81569 RepID=UPI00147F4DA8|nr:RHS repeat protein [Ruegeria atlantica]